MNMKKIGIICEYNPFHNGHLYHINKIKEMYPDSIIILVMSGNFTQRGIPSILSKEEKTNIALSNKIDLVIELPFIFSTQSADIFARASVSILKKFKVDYLVFGSESNDIQKLKNFANIQINDKNYNENVKKYLDKGLNYPTAMAKALGENNLEVCPNDILGLSYVKEIIKQDCKIEPVTISRINNFHSKELSEISSSTAIRNAILNNKDFNKSVPLEVFNLLKGKKNKNYFNYLKYKIISEGKNINKYLTVDEGIENRILKVINECNSTEELINKIKTKRYTYNKISRMLTHILCSLTKEEAKNNIDIKYIHVLGFNHIGQKYLNTIKKELDVPLITTVKYYKKLLEIEYRIDKIYNLI